MQDPQYDEYGGITDTIAEKKATAVNSKKRQGYNFIEKLLIKYSRKINYLFGNNGKYKCRQLKFPPVIRIGPTNRCTARCYYCPREYIHENGTGYMQWELYKSIISQAKQGGTKKISFALFGEPLLHPQIIEMLEYARQAGLQLGLSTNGIVLTKELSDKILKEFSYETI